MMKRSQVAFEENDEEDDEVMQCVIRVQRNIRLRKVDWRMMAMQLLTMRTEWVSLHWSP